MKGIFPKTYVSITRELDDDPITKELRGVLREWGALMRQYYLERRMKEYTTIKDRMKVLLDWHRIITSPHTPPKALAELKPRVMSNIEEGRRLLGLDMIVKTPSGEPATENNTAVLKLYRMHQELASKDTTPGANKDASADKAKDKNPLTASRDLLGQQSSMVDLNAKSAKLISVTTAKEIAQHCLLLELKLSMCQVGEPTELYFSLYSARSGQNLTEEFKVGLTANGLPPDINAIGTMKSWFEVAELHGGDAYLVCRMVRKGQLVWDDSAKAKKEVKDDEALRRPFACGVMPLAELGLGLGKESEHSMKMFAPKEEEKFGTLPDLIIQNVASAYQSQPKGSLSLGLRLFGGTFDHVVKSFSDLSRFPLQQKLNINDSQNQNQVGRNDLYITLDSAIVASEAGDKNLELLVGVRDDNGYPVNNCFSSGTGEKPVTEFKSLVLHKCGSPVWKETIRVNVKPEDYPRCHLYFTFQSVGKKGAKVISNGFLRLTNADGTVATDGTKEVATFKPPRSVDERAFYLDAASSNKLAIRKGEVIKLKTTLCSTYLTQNASMLGLLQWRQQNDLAGMLNKFSFVDQNEIVKFLKETFDSLFAILVSPSCQGNTKLSLQVYDAIVNTIQLLYDEKQGQSTHRSALDSYIIHYQQAEVKPAASAPAPTAASAVPNHRQRNSVLGSPTGSGVPPTSPGLRRPGGSPDDADNNFSKMHKNLMFCLKEQFKELTTSTTPSPISGKKLIPTVKALEYLLKFILASRILYDRTNPQDALRTKEEFKCDMAGFFDVFNELMAQKADWLIGAQTLAVRHFSRFFAHLESLFSIQERSSIAGKFLDSVKGNTTTRLNVEKLLLIHSIISDSLFQNAGARKQLMPVVLSNLKHFLSSSDRLEEKRECISVLFLLLEQLQTNLASETNVWDSGVASVLPEVLRCIDLMGQPGQQGDKAMQADIVMCLLSILYLLAPQNYQGFLHSLNGEDNIRNTLIALFRNLSSLISERPAFPENWFGLQMFQYSTISKVISIMNDILPFRLGFLSADGSGPTGAKPSSFGGGGSGIGPRTVGGPTSSLSSSVSSSPGGSSFRGPSPLTSSSSGTAGGPAPASPAPSRPTPGVPSRVGASPVSGGLVSSSPFNSPGGPASASYAGPAASSSVPIPARGGVANRFLQAVNTPGSPSGGSPVSSPSPSPSPSPSSPGFPRPGGPGGVAGARPVPATPPRSIPGAGGAAADVNRSSSMSPPPNGSAPSPVGSLGSSSSGTSGTPVSPAPMRAGTAIARSPAPRRLSNSPAAGGSSITGRGLPLPARRKAAADSGDSATVMERKVFEAFFTLTINFITAGPLTMEKFTAQKQSLIHTEYGDMRLPVMDHFKKVWNVLGPRQTLFIKALVGPFLELAMVEEPQLKEAGLTLYFSTLTREFSATRTFRGVETQTIDALDKIVNERFASSASNASLTGLSRSGSTIGRPVGAMITSATSTQAQQAADSFKKYFRATLNVRFEAEKDEALREHGLSFLQDMEKIVDLFTALRVLPKAYDDDRTEATMQLMQYLKQTDRQDKYVKYIHDLCKQHEANGHLVEAGLTLLLHAELYDWTEDTVPPMGPHQNSEIAWERKERLYFQAIDFFDHGKAWEKAIDLMEKLRFQYQRIFFDYEKLSNVLARQARFFSSIVSEERFYSDYFFVGFFGKGFPANLANRQFIFKGYELEHSRDFQARITALWPAAELLNFTEAPGEEVKNSYKQHLQIYTVKAASVEEMEAKEKVVNERMPPSIKKFLQGNDVKVFVYSKPFRKDKQKNKENEFEDLWIRNSYFMTADAFPGIRRRAEIVESRIIEVTPIQNAVNSIQSKNEELKEIIIKHGSSRDLNINPFTMVLNGVIDAAVAGGVAMYQKAFLTPAYASANPGDMPLINKLKNNILYQVDILEKGLNIHAIVCSADMAGLQEQLEIKYEQLKRGVEEYRAQLPEGWVVPTFKLPSSISAEMSEDIARLSKSPAVAKLSTRSESTDMLDRISNDSSGEIPTIPALSSSPNFKGTVKAKKAKSDKEKKEKKPARKDKS